MGKKKVPNVPPPLPPAVRVAVHPPALSRSLLQAGFSEEPGRGHVRFRRVLRARRHRLLRPTRSALERSELHMGGILQEFPCHLLGRQSLKRFPDALIES